MKIINKHFEVIAFILGFIGCILAAGGNEYFLPFIIPAIIYLVREDIRETAKERAEEETNC